MIGTPTTTTQPPTLDYQSPGTQKRQSRVVYGFAATVHCLIAFAMLMAALLRVYDFATAGHGRPLPTETYLYSLAAIWFFYGAWHFTVLTASPPPR